MTSKEKILKLINKWLRDTKSNFEESLQYLPEHYGKNPTEEDVMNIDDPENHASFTLGEKRCLEMLKEQIEATEE